MLSVTLLSGFLGAGKTTLLNRILTLEHGLRFGVVVNDFGALEIDARSVVNVDGDVVSLANGCVCCSMRTDLMAALQQLRRAEPPVEHVLVECSGVADPRVLARTFMALERGLKLELDGIVVLVDSEHFFELDGRELSFVRDQLEVSDLVLLNKADRATPDDLERLRAEVERYAPTAAVVESTFAEVPLELVLGGHGLDPRRLDSESESRLEAPEFSTASYRATTPLALERLRAVSIDLPRGIYRAKGFVYLAERPERRTVLHVVGRRARLGLGEPWGDEEPATELVFIGRPGSVDAVELERAFDSCQTAEVADGVLGSAREWLRSYWPKR